MLVKYKSEYSNVFLQGLHSRLICEMTTVKL